MIGFLCIHENPAMPLMNLLLFEPLITVRSQYPEWTLLKHEVLNLWPYRVLARALLEKFMWKEKI